MSNGVETTDFRFDEDPEFLALIAAEAAEKAQLVETDFYAFNGELYSKEEIIYKGRECPYLRGMGAAAFEATINSFRVYEGAEPPTPPQHPAHEALKPTELPIEPVVHETAALAAHAEQVRHMQAEEVMPTLAVEAVTVPEAILAAPVIAETPAIEITLPLAVEVQLPAVSETAVSEEVMPSNQTDEQITEEISVPAQIVELVPAVDELPAVQAVVEREPAEEVQPSLDRELLAEVHPEVAQDLEALIEHIGLEALTEAAENAEPIMPSSLKEAIEERQQESTPEEAVVIEALSMLIEAACERLLVLEDAGLTEEYEAVEIEKMLTKWLEELNELGVEHNETVAELKEVIRRRLVLLHSEPALEDAALAEVESTDEGTHEKKHFISQLLSGNNTEDTETLSQHWWAGRLAVAGH